MDDASPHSPTAARISAPLWIGSSTGVGSSWTNFADLHVGDRGSGNQLVVSNGAWIGGIDGSIGEFDIASNNLAVVTGANGGIALP